MNRRSFHVKHRQLAHGSAHPSGSSRGPRRRGVSDCAIDARVRPQQSRGVSLGLHRPNSEGPRQPWRSARPTVDAITQVHPSLNGEPVGFIVWAQELTTGDAVAESPADSARSPCHYSLGVDRICTRLHSARRDGTHLRDPHDRSRRAPRIGTLRGTPAHTLLRCGMAAEVTTPNRYGHPQVRWRTACEPR